MPPIQTFTLDNEYIVKVQPPTNTYPITKIKIGGKHRQCVSIDVYNHRNDAYMPGFSYHRKCNINEDLIRSVGTHSLMNASLAYVLQEFPKLPGVTLRDTSKVTCTNGVQISLRFLSLALHGSTWYEKHFGAKFEDVDQRKKYRSMKAYLKGSMMKVTDFLKIIGASGVNAFRFTELYKDCRKKGASYMDFFVALNKQYGECSVFTENGGWLEKFMESLPDKPDFMEACWIIKRKRVNGIGSKIVRGENGIVGGGIKRLDLTKKKDIVLISMDEL